MDKKILKETLEQHKLWIESSGDEGNRADLCRANLSGADLCRADLCRADLYGADLCRADLCRADLCRADLCRANFSGANLSGADLYGANLCRADLCRANLSGANLSGANLYGANLCRADLSGADLREAINVPFIPMACPDSGSFIGWKKACEYIVKLLIPEDAQRSSSTGRKCRTDKAVVLAIENVDGSTSELKEVCSIYDRNFIYRVGEKVAVDNFDENRFNECAPGIHFFINRQEAVDY